MAGALISIIISFILLIICLALLLYGLNDLRYAITRTIQAYRSKNWPSITGKITRAHSKVTAVNRRLNGMGDKQIIEIEYTYNVDGQTYVGDNIFWGKETKYTWSNEIVREYMSKFQKNKEVQIFYNPSNPKISVLERENISWLSRKYWTGTLMTIMGIGTWFSFGKLSLEIFASYF